MPVDVDDLIQRHKQRLDEHRKFLEHTRSTTPTQRARPGPAQTTPREGPSSAEKLSRMEYEGRSRERSPITRPGFTDPKGTPYVTASPTGVFDRAQRWIHNKNRYLNSQHEEAVEKEMRDCTFRPNTNRARSEALLAGKRFSPSTTKLFDNDARADRLREDATAHHVQRQDSARREREASKRRVTCDTSRWQSRTTKPQEFQFGQRVHQISSLRKPVLVAAVQSPGGSEEADADFEPEEPQTEEPEESRGAAAQPRATHQSDLEVPATHHVRSGIRAPSPERVEVEMLRNKLAAQDVEMAKLRGVIVSLRRELEIAKGKVRQLSLTQQMSDHINS